MSTALEKEHTATTAGTAESGLAAQALYTFVFMTGGLLMGIEIAGSRVLAPAFGNSIFVWGSLIGIVMVAMALGAFFGGTLADRKPSFGVLATLVSLSGLFTFIVLPYLGQFICTGVGMTFPHRILGPLIACAVLFFVPCMLMAAVPPYALKLRTENLNVLGGMTGNMWALFTVGGIIGTLLTTFFMIPHLNTANVLQGMGCSLMILSSICLYLFKRQQGVQKRSERDLMAMSALLPLACLAAWIASPIQPHVSSGERLVLYKESAYHDVAVTEDVVARIGPSRSRILTPMEVTRWLKFNENLESGIFPYKNYYDNAVKYTDLLHLTLIWNQTPKKVLVVGGGGGLAPTQFVKHYPSVERVDVLELDPVVAQISISHFDVPTGPDSKIHFYIGDARTHLRDLPGGYDIAILDAYSSGGQIPFHLLTWEFLEEVKSKLNPDGLLATNIISAVENSGTSGRPADLFLAEYKTLYASKADVRGIRNPSAEESAPLYRQVYVFPRVYNRADSLRTNADRSRNIIVIASQEQARKSADEILATAKRLTQGKDPLVKIPASNFVWHAEHLYQKTPDAETLKRIPLLKDDHAPVDTMYRSIKQEENIQRVQ